MASEAQAPRQLSSPKNGRLDCLLIIYICICMIIIIYDNIDIIYDNIDSPYINRHFIYNHCYIHLQVQGYGGSLAHPLLLHIAISLLTPVRPSTISFLDTFWRTFRNLCSRFLCISSRFLHRHHLRPLLSGFVTTFGLLGRSSTCSSTSHSPFSCWNKLSSSS